MNKRNFLKLLPLTLLLGGCSKPSSVTKESLSISQIKGLFDKADIWAENEIFLDREYGLPTINWITDILYPELFKRNKSNKAWLYMPESNDCDDFASRARSLANELNNATTNSGIRGLAFGEYHYYKTDTSQHALNFAIVKDGTDYKIVFFEPQNGQLYQLTKNQIESVICWII